MPQPVIRDEIELGLPHLAPNALGDAPTLKHLGHLRWLSFEYATGVPTSLVADSKGRRLYATFYYIDINYPMSAPAGAFRENDRVVFAGDLNAYGRNILDGFFALFRAGDEREREWGVPDVNNAARFLEAGIPYIRLSNIFIQQEQGPDKLRIGQPSNCNFSKINAIREAPDGHERNREAKEKGFFFAPPENARAAHVTFQHPIDPDRDVNAAGLVYFANFPAFFEVAERRSLAELPDFPRDFTERRGTLRRQVGFFGNARTNDSLLIHSQCAVANEPVMADTPARPHGLLWFSTLCSRASDRSLIAITTVSKLTPLAQSEDVERWRAAARRANEERAREGAPSAILAP